jgi:hypothetical protein
MRHVSAQKYISAIGILMPWERRHPWVGVEQGRPTLTIALSVQFATLGTATCGYTGF